MMPAATTTYEEQQPPERVLDGRQHRTARQLGRRQAADRRWYREDNDTCADDGGDDSVM